MLEALKTTSEKSAELAPILHSVENLTMLYRGRRYWHTPQLNQAMAKIIDHFGDRSNISPLFVVELVNEINKMHWSEGWVTFYEPCPVVKTTAMEVIVVSQDMPKEIGDAYPVYAGGRFNINKPKLQRGGKAYHSRYGEYFYINAPESAIALEERKLLEVIS